MNIEFKPWEWTTEVKEGGAYSLVKADEETRKKQLEEYKKNRIAELKKDMNEIENLF